MVETQIEDMSFEVAMAELEPVGVTPLDAS